MYIILVSLAYSMRESNWFVMVVRDAVTVDYLSTIAMLVRSCMDRSVAIGTALPPKVAPPRHRKPSARSHSGTFPAAPPLSLGLPHKSPLSLQDV